MHEFTTDILQVRIIDNEIGKLVFESALFKQELHADTSKRDWLYESSWLTIESALALSGAHLLDVDPTEIATVLRRSHESGTLGNREIIMYDKTAGGSLVT